MRYGGETCRKHPTPPTTPPSPSSSHPPPPLFDVHGSSPSLFSFIYGDESAGCSHWCSQDLQKFCSEILTSNSLFHFWRLMPPAPPNTPPTFVLQQLLYSLPHRCLGWKMGPLFAFFFFFFFSIVILNILLINSFVSNLNISRALSLRRTNRGRTAKCHGV